jgi:hypothetical protein
METLSDDEYENIFLYRWSHVGKKDKKRTRKLFSHDKFIFQVHGCIQ